MYSVHEVCELLGFAKATLINWEKANKIPKPARTLLGNRVYSLDSIKDILRCLTPNQKLQAKHNLIEVIHRYERDITKLESLLNSVS